jgi:hypothetical protein
MFDTLETSELECQLVGLAGRLASAHCRFLLLLAEFDARQGWAGPGIRSCTHWLSWRVGLSRRTGRDQLRVARALPRLPAIAAAFGAGRLSYTKVRAITRIATPDTEQTLLDVALAGTAGQVERMVRAARAAAKSGAGFAAERSASWRWDEDGHLVLRAKLPPEQGALLVAALENQLAGPPVTGVEAPSAHVGGPAEPRPPDSDDVWPGESRCAQLEHPPGQTVDRPAARRADALMSLLAPDAGEHHVVMHLHIGDGEARLDNGVSITTSTAERLACDSRVQTLITDRTGNPLYLGRTSRTVSAAQRDALTIRDNHTCQFPGCEHRKFLHAHYIRHWLHGGPTDIDNLVLICGFHHRLMHDHRYTAVLRGTHLRVWRHDGSEVTAQYPAPAIDRLTADQALLTEHGTAAESIVPIWSGERLDLDAVLAALLPEAAATERGRSHHGDSERSATG